MAEVITGEYSKYRSTLLDIHQSIMVVLWDCGPERPTPPERPETPRGKAGDPQYDLAVIELKEKIEDYEVALKAFGAALRHHEAWWRRHGGPVEQTFWSCDARDALANDARAVQEGRQTRARWYLSSRTRGYDHLENSAQIRLLKEGLVDD
jgi:hypothetical protein